MTINHVRETRDALIGASGDGVDGQDELTAEGLPGLLEPLEQLSPSTYVGATLGSIALSLALYAGGRKDAGIFVGLWARTFLNLGLYLKQLRPSRRG
jgi:hypothetical protein